MEKEQATNEVCYQTADVRTTHRSRCEPKAHIDGRLVHMGARFVATVSVEHSTQETNPRTSGPVCANVS